MCPAQLRRGVRLQALSRCFFPLRRISRRLAAWSCACLALCSVSWQSARAESDAGASAPQWVYMPAGSRATYIGIHGGTVPVSLLASRDGTHMVALVGRTGNDFLRTLKVGPGAGGALSSKPSATLPFLDGWEAAGLAHPSLQPLAVPARPSFRLTANATLLMADTAVGAMPVIYATGHSFAGLSQLYADSLLFGIADNSPLLEGSVKAPTASAKKAKTGKRRPLVRGSSAPVGQ